MGSDFNDPCKEEDRPDRKSASAKTIIRVQVGNDLLKAGDVFEAQCYVVQDVMMCIAENDYAKASNSVLN